MVQNLELSAATIVSCVRDEGTTLIYGGMANDAHTTVMRNDLNYGMKVGDLMVSALAHRWPALHKGCSWLICE